MTGAAILSSLAALRCGAGYIEVASDEEVLRAVSFHIPEAVLAKIDKISDILKTATVLLIGCGLSTEKNSADLFFNTISLSKNIPTVIDADGLNILAKESLYNRVKLPKNVVLTPHPKEAARLLNCELNEILNDTLSAAKKISTMYKCITVLKTHKTIVTDGNDKLYINTTGNSALAKAGSGDVLAGMIAGLMAQKMNLFDAAVLGVYLHGLAGDLAKNDLSAYGVLATDTIRYIPLAIKKFLSVQV